MRDAVHQGESEEDSDSTHASADAARLHAVARRIQLREHASRQQQLQLHKQLQQQQQLLQQQQQQLHQQDALLRHQEQLLRQQEQQLASRETEAGLLLRQVSLLQQQLEERADRLAAAEGNYLDVTASLQQLQQRVALGDEARLLVEEVRQQQQQDTQHLYAEVRRLRRQLSHRMQLSLSSEEKDRCGMSSREKEADLEKDSAHGGACSESPAQQVAARGGHQQPPSGGLSLPPRRTEGEPLDIYTATGPWCCAEAAEAASCTAWGCSACCCCSSDDQHEAVVGDLRAALHSCRCVMENRVSGETEPSSAAASGAAALAVREALHRCPAAGADPEIVGILLERLRAESMQIRVYSQQRHAASSSMTASNTELQLQHQGGLASIDESMEREAYEVLGTALSDEVLLPLLAVQNISSLLRLKQQGVLLANSRWLQLLKDTVGSKFLEGSCCRSGGDKNSTTGLMHGKKALGASPQGNLTDNGAVTPAGSWDTRGEHRQHVLLQLLLRGSGGVAAAAGLLRHGAAPLSLYAATLTDRDSGNNVFHLICLRNLPQLFGTLSLTSLPCELLYAQNRQGKTPADLLPLLLPPHLQELNELQKAAAAGEMQQRADFQEGISGVSCNLRAWRSVVFEYAAKASSLYRQHRNEAALALYTEALKLQQRLLEKQQQLDEVTGGVSSSNLSLMENTAKLAFNKGRSALRLGRWICSLQSCSLCLSMTPNYKAAYETAAEACEWLLDFEGALNFMQLMRQHCPDSFAAEHYQKRRLYEAQLQASSFQVLGIERGAPKAAVNRAFRRMSILWHPDKASALSEDLRLRHENHFKRLNEARITLLDAESYARQLLLPIQPLYRHPELLVVAKPVQQSTPSPTLVQPEQLTTEQQQQHDTQQQNDQQQGQDSRQQEADETEPRLEKLQQQRQQLLRSIGSLQRQQHELQRELEEHQAAAAQQSSWNSTSNSLRWHELQKLQQQQQNKQRRLIECETEIDQWLHRKQQQHHEDQQHQLSQQPQQPDESQHQNQQQQRGESQSTETEKVEGCAGENQTYSSTASHRCEWQQTQQRIPGNCEEETPSAAPSCQTAAQAFHQSVYCVSPSVAAAADVINEAAAAALSGRDQTKPEGDSPSWDSATSSDSDTDAAKPHTVFEGYGHVGGNNSSGFPTATTAVPTPPPLRREANASTQQRRSSSEIPPSRTSPREVTGAANAGRARDYSGAGVSRLPGRCGSRASSAGPQIRTGEATRTATTAAPAATARRSLTTCIYSTAPRHAAGAAELGKATQPKRNTAYWEETDSSSKSSTSDSSSCSSSSSGSNSEGEKGTTDRGTDRQWTEANVFGRGKLAAAATGAAAANTAGAGTPAVSGSAAKSSVQPRQQQLPSPPPRRVAATQGVRKDGSRSSSAGSGGCKTRGTSGRRRFVRTRGYLQQQQGAPQQQRHGQHKHQEQPQRRQQLWRGAVSGNEAAGGAYQTETTNVTVAGGPSSDVTPQATKAAAAAWLLPPNFPEPFGAEGCPLQHQADNLGHASGHAPQQQQEQRKPHCDHPDPESVLHAVGHQQSEGAREQTLVDSPALLPQSLDAHRLRQQRLQQDIQQQHMLHRELQQQREMQAAAQADRRQLLFPDEDLLTFPASAEATEAGRPVVSGETVATAGRSVPATQAEEPSAPPDGRWANFEENLQPSPDKGQPQRNPRWPVPPQCRNAVAEAGSCPAHSALHFRRGQESAIPAEGNPAEICGGGQGTYNPEMQQPRSASAGGAASAGESCGSNASNLSPGRTGRRGSTSGRNSSSNSEAEDPADPLRASGQWRSPIYSQQKRHLPQQEQEHLYRSVAQDTFPQQIPPEADAAGPSHWGMAAPQRSSVPPLGCSSVGVNDSAPLRRGTATATPTRLFPHYDPADVDMQRSTRGVSFSGSHETSCSAPSGGGGGATAALCEGHSANAGDACRQLSPRGDASSALGGSGAPVRSESRQVGEVPPVLGSWQHLRTRGSLPQTRENVLLHSPSRSQRM
ncbi:DnaJ domain-containing protein, putative [Eimeria praecox]|uniref:DnaJ domain-containing protein, putative n=1 Tax=Eimeria praecox TaxID=51316 RepID=U6GNF7_9EIME|nr:DnaJ domain-containing protein, putative [Eimeria praecox]